MSSGRRAANRVTAAAAAAGEDPAEHVVQHQPMPPRPGSGHEATRRDRQSGIGFDFAGLAIDPDRDRVTARKFEGDNRAGIADHGATHQFPQALGIRGLSRLARGHVGRAEFLERPEHAGLQERHEVV